MTHRGPFQPLTFCDSVNHTLQPCSWKEPYTLAFSCLYSCQCSSCSAPLRAASQRSTIVPVIPSDSCQLLGVQSAEREPLGWQIPTGLGPPICLACGTMTPNLCCVWEWNDSDSCSSYSGQPVRCSCCQWSVREWRLIKVGHPELTYLCQVYTLAEGDFFRGSTLES